MISALSVGLAAITGVILPTPSHLVTATHLKTGHPYKKSTGTRSLNGLQFLAKLTECRDNCSNNDH